MQNKGLVLSFTIALILVCLFYLSFNVVTSHYNKQAKEFAQGNVMEEYRYLDSLSTEKVWLNYTLKECREKELNLGLDLKGGMNVIIEVSVPDILKTLAGNSTDETFTKAIQLAHQRQATSQKGFIDLFQEAFQEIDKDARLAAIFSTYELKDKVNLKSTNAEVIAVIKEEVQATVDNSFNVLRTRIDRFGVVQPNIQRLETNGRILIELPGVKEPERVRKLLQGSANLEFWETYTLPEVYEPLMLANNVIKELKEEKAPAVDTTATVVATEEVKAPAEVEKDNVTSLLTQLEQPKDSVSDDDFSKENPLFAILQLNVRDGQLVNTPAVGVAHQKDTAKVKEYLNLRQVKEVLPRDVAFKWTVKAIDTKGNFFELIAVKVTSRDGEAPLEGSAISDARSDFGQFSSNSVVSMTMNPEGARTWARLTKENIGRSIAIVLDDMVYSYPNVNTEITGGRSEISGNFTVEEAKDLANVLKAGKLPAPTRIVEDAFIGPSLGQEAINQGYLSMAVGLILVIVFMIGYYGNPGWMANAALLFNVFFIAGVLVQMQSALTLPGIAGVVLTLGMAVDANVLINERIREELHRGVGLLDAVRLGYDKALSAILDGNVTTFLIGVILIIFGSGSVKGFGVTLCIGLVTSVFTAVFVSHVLVDWMVQRKIAAGKEKEVTFETFISKDLFKGMNFDFIGKRKYSYWFSWSLIAEVS